jgi:hypothetical protein
MLIRYTGLGFRFVAESSLLREMQSIIEAVGLRRLVKSTQGSRGPLGPGRRVWSSVPRRRAQQHRPHNQGRYRKIAAAILRAYRRHDVEPNVVAQIRHRPGFARLGHRDHGRTVMMVYGLVRQEHNKAAAAREKL